MAWRGAWWPDRCPTAGRKRPLQWGLLGFTLLRLDAGRARPRPSRSALSGLCAAVIQPNALALVADLAPREQLGKRLGQVFIGLMLACADAGAERPAGRHRRLAGQLLRAGRLRPAGLVAVWRGFASGGGHAAADFHAGRRLAGARG